MTDLTTIDTDLSGITTGHHELPTYHNVQPTGDPVLDMIQRAALDPRVDAEKLEKLLQLANQQEDRRRSRDLEDRAFEARVIFDKAFKQAQGKMPQIVKSAKNDQTNSMYAEMEAIDRAITPVMNAHGFGITFKMGGEPKSENHLHVLAVLTHEGGHREHYEDHVPLAGVGAKGNRMMTHTHGHGATKTYARRYLKLDIWDLIPMDADSDGNANNVNEHSFDTTPWTQEIMDAQDMVTMQAITEKLKKTDIPPNALKMLRTAWAGRAKEIGAQNAA